MIWSNEHRVKTSQTSCTVKYKVERRNLYVVRGSTGEINWTFGTEGMIYSAWALSDYYVYVMTTTGELYALE